MKSKQTLKVGDSVRVIKPSSHYLFKEGFIEKKGDVYDWEVSIDDETHYYDNKDIQLITSKKSHWEYSREEIAKELDRWVGVDINVIKEQLLAKQSTTKKKSKEIKQEDKKEWKPVPYKCTGCGYLADKTGLCDSDSGCNYKNKLSPSLLNDIETIEEIPLDDGDCRVRDIVNLLIKNDRIHTQILNLLIKNK